MVRYRPGVTDAQFEAAVAKAVQPGTVSDSGTFTSVVDSLRSTAGVLANGLLVFAPSPRSSGSCCSPRCWRATRNGE